ncbi:MAG: TraR/DksA family transcriptional regulator [Alphaproteobacteria bacterium]
MTNPRNFDPKAIKAALEREHDELLHMSKAAAADRRPVELDQQSVGRLSRMDALQSQAMAQALEARRQERLQRIAGAQRRLQDDEYGECAICGTEIAPKRLEFDPTVTRCVDCAE